MKRILASLAVASTLMIGGGAAASASTSYPVAPQDCSVMPSSIRVGETATITCTWDDAVAEGQVVEFSTEGPAVGVGTLASIAGSAGASTAAKTIESQSAQVVFTGPASRVYEIAVRWGEGADAQTVTAVPVTVLDANGELAATGGTGGDSALWAGLGAVLLGASVVVMAAMRRGGYR